MGCNDCRIVRNILADKPRVTKFPIEFDAPAAADALPVAGDMSGAVDGGFGEQQAADQQQQVCHCSTIVVRLSST